MSSERISGSTITRKAIWFSDESKAALILIFSVDDCHGTFSELLGPFPLFYVNKDPSNPFHKVNVKTSLTKLLKNLQKVKASSEFPSKNVIQ